MGSMETVGLIDQKEKKARTVSGKDEKKKKTGTLKILALPTEIDNQWPTG